MSNAAQTQAARRRSTAIVNRLDAHRGDPARPSKARGRGKGKGKGKGKDNGDGIPVPPGVVANVLSAAADPKTGASDLAKLLRPDPTMTAHILKAANSPIYRLPAGVTQVERAVSMMGVRSVRNVVLTVGLGDIVPSSGIAGLPTRDFWESSLRRGAAAAAIAIRKGFSNADDYFTLGLCQDLGVVMRAMQEESKLRYEDVFAWSGEERLALERATGDGHDAAGATMLATWGLPKDMIEPIRHHHRPDEAPEEYAKQARILFLADLLADVLSCSDRWLALKRAETEMEAEGFGADDIEAVISEMSSTVEEYAEFFGLDDREQPSYEEIMRIASKGLARLNVHYEAVTRELEDALAQKEKMARELQALTAELERRALTDELTQLPNRRLFQESLHKEIAQARRRSAELSVIMLDVDHFKRCNDEWGHQGGDAVLATIGKVLAHSVRDCDVAARYGGEEFVVVLPFTDATGAQLVAERIRAAIEAAIVPGWDGLRVTASLGTATLDPAVGGTATEIGERLVADADHALYEAKAKGRNRVVAAG